MQASRPIGLAISLAPALNVTLRALEACVVKPVYAYMNFNVDKEKAIEALVYIAARVPGVGRFHASKILYFAERRHLRIYARPIVGDRYIAMENGPVPSFAYNVLKDALPPRDRQLADGALLPIDTSHHPAYRAAREARTDFFSRSDLDCLDWAIGHCADRSFGSISDETHRHIAWDKAGLNAPMQFADFMDDVDEDIVEDAKAFAAYGIL